MLFQFRNNLEVELGAVAAHIHIIGWLPSVLWCCWLGSRKGMRPVKNLSGVGLAWLSVWSELMPLPLTVSCFSKIQTLFTFLILTHPGSPVQRAVNRACAVVDVVTGLAGSEVAQYAAVHFPEFLKTIDDYSEGSLAAALENAFLGFDATLVTEEVKKQLKLLAAGGDKTEEGEETDEESMLIIF